MARSWTPAQNLAITIRDKSLLVSAAAGAGKTATLTERIIQSLTDKDSPVDIDSMLVVTFTRAAAAELRQRISASIADALANDPSNKQLSEQLIKMSSAKISTIDSFYLDMLRSHFDKIDISPSFRTADENELALLARSLMEDTIDEFYEAHPAEFSQITECFVNVRDGANLSNIFLDLHKKTESLPEGVGFLKSAANKAREDAEKDFLEGSYGALIVSSITESMNYYLGALKSLCDKYGDMISLPSVIGDMSFCKELVELLSKKSYADCFNHVKEYKAVRKSTLSKIGVSEEDDKCYTALRNKLKSEIDSISRSIFGIAPERVSDALKRTADICHYLYELLRDFEERFTKEKRQKNIMSFSDIRRSAYKLLVNEDGSPTKTALEYSERYTQIYIDEYQDVDLVQDLIFRAISKPTSRFMVGDIKQSIYGFRGAEPSVFASYRRNFPDIKSEEAKTSCEASIFMSNNFRCDSTVIRFANGVCSHLFSECAESMNYSSGDDLIFSKITENRLCEETPVEVTVIVPNEEYEESANESDDEGGKELEAKYIAHKISELLKTGKKADGSRILPQDIAVLYRTNTMAQPLRLALSKLGIGTSSGADSHYFENPDVLLVLCLLNVIDNPQRDVYLAGLLRSPFFEFTLDELIQIRGRDTSHSLYDALCLFSKNDGELARRCESFNELLTELRDVAASLPVDKLLRYLYSTDMFLSARLVSTDDSSNLMRLYEYARSFESSSFKGLYNFIVYINRIIEEGKKLPSPSDIMSDGKVSLLTIHESKGLEFPVCFICNAGATFSNQDSRESLVFNSHHGMAMKISDGSGYARLNTPMREALIRATRISQVEEEMRVLYVALTRAREKLFVTATSGRSRRQTILNNANIARRFKCRHSVLSASSYLEWILAAINAEEEHPFCRISLIEKAEVSATKIAKTIKEATEAEAVQCEEIKELLHERFSFRYPHEAATKLPAKITVSSLLYSKDEEDSAKPFEKSETEEYTVPSVFGGESDPSSAKKGTATHLFLQFCDLENMRINGVDAEISRLIEKRFIPESSRELIFKDEISAFIESTLFEKIRSSKRVLREQRFNIVLPPSLLNDDPSFVAETDGEFLAVQGVIDLVIENVNGGIFLYDYKTDRLRPKELCDDELLKERMIRDHAKQIRYYAEAVKRLFDKECRGAFIYSTHAAKEIEIPLIS